MCYQVSGWVQHLYTFVAIALILVWERWLGRTCKVRAASTIDLVINLGKHLFGIKTETPQLLLTGHVEGEDEMFEGNEFEKDLGAYGKVVADIDDSLSVSVSLKFDAMKALQDVAAKTQKAWLRTGLNLALGFFNKGVPQVASASTPAKPAAAPSQPAAQPSAPSAPEKSEPGADGSLAVSNNALKEESPGEVKRGESV